MRATKTTIRFKLSRAEDARALEYLRNQKAAGGSFSKSVVQAINDSLDSQEAESREDSFMGRFRLMLREELKGLGNTVPFQPVSESSQPSAMRNRNPQCDEGHPPGHPYGFYQRMLGGTGTAARLPTGQHCPASART